MRLIRLKRITEIEDGTFGILFDESVPFCLSLERKWLNNKSGESCIPKGEYICEKVESPKFGQTYEVKSVPGRSEILFHKGNLQEDSHGCIIVAEKFGELDGKIAILSSGEAFSEFLEKLHGENEFKLIVTYVKDTD